MEFLIFIIVCGAMGALTCFIEIWMDRKREKSMLKEMELVDFFETVLYDRITMFSVRKYKDKYYLVICQDGGKARIMGCWYPD